MRHKTRFILLIAGIFGLNLRLCAVGAVVAVIGIIIRVAQL